MLHEGWQTGKTDRGTVPLERLADHIQRVCDLAGNTDHAAIGSDLDGGFGTEQTPGGLPTGSRICRSSTGS
jgi:membrane dipeptidase